MLVVLGLKLVLVAPWKGFKSSQIGIHPGHCLLKSLLQADLIDQPCTWRMAELSSR